jgi:alanyl-tRNA synthetase
MIILNLKTSSLRIANRNVFRKFKNTAIYDTIWPVNKVRDTFVKYFEEKRNHTHYLSSPVVPVNDPTLLFTNAGMNQFKPIFIGTIEPNSPLNGLVRAVNSQKCIRAGGKHNDLDDVGKDTYHHTFFEMLGTWSFGDYFKKEAIAWAFDILTNTYKLPADRLYASYFAGDEIQGLPCDTEARDIWLQYLPSSRVLPFDKKANFWEMVCHSNIFIF